MEFLFMLLLVEGDGLVAKIFFHNKLPTQLPCSTMACCRRNPAKNQGRKGGGNETEHAHKQSQQLCIRNQHHKSAEGGADFASSLDPSSKSTSPLDSITAFKPDILSPSSFILFALMAFYIVDACLCDLWLPPANAVDASLITEIDVAGILQKAGKKALGGGLSGAVASLVQLITLMWLRTTMQYQYRYGLPFAATVQQLYKEGGITRFYQGLPVALFQLPLSRFADVAANAFMIAALDSFESTRGLPLPLKSAFGSIAAGTWRLVLTPLDVVKTTLQVLFVM